MSRTFTKVMGGDALMLADLLEQPGERHLIAFGAAAELRRQHEEIVRLRTIIECLRDIIADVRDDGP